MNSTEILTIFDREQWKIYHARLMYARPFIDSIDFARNGRQLHGEVPVALLPRLLDMLADTHGTIEYTVRGGIGRHGIPMLDVGIAGDCMLRCQRCLNGMDYPVRLDVRLLLRDQAGLDELDKSGGDEEEFDSILADSSLDVLNLLEEEILLSMPIAPSHEFGACQVADAGSRHDEDKKPFAVLEKLKRN